MSWPVPEGRHYLAGPPRWWYRERRGAQISLLHELDQARGTVAKLAANEERLRLARDMHDLTGQSLSMITLKSELAVKRLAKLPSSAERDAVLTELGDIGRVSRQTLHDIREAVSGYRRPTLAIEVITARNALEAAGTALADGVNPLTPRERDVLEASSDGRTIAEIAAQLYLSEGTVRNYLSACIQKTGARNRAEALRIASERGWL